MQEIDGLNDKHYAETKEAVDKLMNIKVALHQHDKILDEQTDEFKGRVGAADANIKAMQF